MADNMPFDSAESLDDDYTQLDDNWKLLATLPLVPLPLLVLVWYSQWLYCARLRPAYYQANPQQASRSNKRAVLSYLEGETWAEHMRRSERDERLHKLGPRLWLVRKYRSSILGRKKGQEMQTAEEHESSQQSASQPSTQTPQPPASPSHTYAGHCSNAGPHLSPGAERRFPSGASPRSPLTAAAAGPPSGAELGLGAQAGVECCEHVGRSGTRSGTAPKHGERLEEADEAKASPSLPRSRRVAFEQRAVSEDKTEGRRDPLSLVELRQQPRWLRASRCTTSADRAPPMRQGGLDEDLMAVSVRRVLSDLGAGDNYGVVAHVMTELYKGCSYLEQCTGPDGALRGNMSLISYRIIKSQVDDFTLDPAAFLSLIGAAAEAGVDFLWLDCWAYRKQPPWAEYRHEDFCRTLGNVLGAGSPCVERRQRCQASESRRWGCETHFSGLVDRVLWLPRSRDSAPGQYQYRVWCTFEACVIGLRKLPVLVCGHKPTRTQLMVASLGSFSIFPPWWTSDGTNVVFLGKINFIFLLVTACVLWTYAMRIAVYFHEKHIVWRAILDYAVLQGFSMAVYAYVRSGLSQEVMLAQNAKRVMRLMLTTARGRIRNNWKKIGQLKRTLPWLPAHDRRDVVTVNVTLENLASQLRSRNSCSAARESATPDPLSASASISAVALSVYFHALANPTPTDDPAGRSLHEWLEDAGIHLPLGPGEKGDGASSGGADCESNTTLWLDEYPLVPGPPCKGPLSRLAAKVPCLCRMYARFTGRQCGGGAGEARGCSVGASGSRCRAARSGVERWGQLRSRLALRSGLFARTVGREAQREAEARSAGAHAERKSPRTKPADVERTSAPSGRAAAADTAHARLSRPSTARVSSAAGAEELVRLGTCTASSACKVRIAELQRLHWEFVRLRFGGTCCAVNPMGDYALALPEVHRDGTAHWKLQHMLSRHCINGSLQIFGMTYYALFFATTVTEMVGTIFGILNDNEDVYLKVLDVVRVLNIIQSTIVYALGCIKLGADMRDIIAGCRQTHRLYCVPLPVRRSGKLELTIPLAVFFAYLMGAANAWSSWNDEERDSQKTSFSDVAWQAFSFNAIWYIAYEATLCVLSAGSAMIALRHVHGASEFLTPFLEKTSVLA